MPDMYKRPYLDSSVYIAAIRGSPPEPTGRADTARRILQDAVDGRYQIYASTFVKVEVVKDSNRPVLQAPQETVDAFLQRSCFVWLDLDIPTAEKARDLARNYGLRPADAVHLATAIKAKADQLLAWDNRFPKGNFEGVLVTEPHWMGQEKLIE